MTDLEQALLNNTAAVTQLSTSIMALLNSAMSSSPMTHVVHSGPNTGMAEQKEQAKPGKPKSDGAPKVEPVASPPPAPVEAASAPSAESTPTASEPSAEPPAEAVTKQTLKELGMKVIQADPAPKGQKVAFKSVLMKFLPGEAAPNLDLIKQADYPAVRDALQAKLAELGDA